MDEREIVKIKSDNPAHAQGFYFGFKDQMGPDDVEFVDNQVDDDPQVDADAQGVDPIKNKKKVRK